MHSLLLLELWSRAGGRNVPLIMNEIDTVFVTLPLTVIETDTLPHTMNETDTVCVTVPLTIIETDTV